MLSVANRLIMMNVVRLCVIMLNVAECRNIQNGAPECCSLTLKRWTRLENEPGTNTLAYFTNISAEEEKRFHNVGFSSQCFKLFFIIDEVAK
jgi:hypothetical protein